MHVKLPFTDLLHQEGSDALVLSLRLCLGIHNDHVRLGPVGDPELAAIEYIMAAFFVCS